MSIAPILDSRAVRTGTDELTSNGVALSIGGSVYDPNDPVGRLLFNLLDLAAAGRHTQAELAELFDLSRTTIYCELRRATN